ncbi:A24 family peptidase [Nakamurella sp. PAMC28650]|uniref:prepilin peptidase n=1 Tax=Nakamurella sp. PAMC28650 TaxID=2762325 RepID=UPI00164DDFFD|nr:A24 family peptidase [Nakamurella sp. PAMC28650]QNK80366.1 prepilin peptidase [Nakamurella sp. PAMC28650]
MEPLIVVVALLGLAIGSFLNVVIHRVPAGMSLSRPGSHCPACAHQIRNRHNIPVVSWLVLRGKCADCRARISVRYPVVELLTAVIFIALVVRVAGEHQLATLPAVLYFTAMGISLSLIDLDVGRLPNAIVYPSYPVLAVLLTAAAVAQGDPAALLRAAVGAFGLFLLYFALAFLYPAGMGFGDVKLAGIIGGVLGFVSYPVLLVGAFSAFLLGSIFGILKIAQGRASGRSAVAFGPFMITGALVSIFVGPALTEFYSSVLLGA